MHQMELIVSHRYGILKKMVVRLDISNFQVVECGQFHILQPQLTSF